MIQYFYPICRFKPHSSRRWTAMGLYLDFVQWMLPLLFLYPIFNYKYIWRTWYVLSGSPVTCSVAEQFWGRTALSWPECRRSSGRPSRFWSKPQGRKKMSMWWHLTQILMPNWRYEHPFKCNKITSVKSAVGESVTSLGQIFLSVTVYYSFCFFNIWKQNIYFYSLMCVCLTMTEEWLNEMEGG